jgi:hypothetical protein
LHKDLRHAKLIGNKHMTTRTAIKEFLRKAGSKGGKKSSMHPDRKRLNREAAESRWRKRLPEPKEILAK